MLTFNLLSSEASAKEDQSSIKKAQLPVKGEPGFADGEMKANQKPVRADGSAAYSSHLKMVPSTIATQALPFASTAILLASPGRSMCISSQPTLSDQRTTRPVLPTIHLVR